MHVGLVLLGKRGQLSGGYRYDRQLVSHLRDQGDDVTVIELPQPGPSDRLEEDSRLHLGRPEIRDRLNQPFDVLIQDELCHASLWRHNPHLEKPETIVALVHHLQSAEPSTKHQRARRTLERRFLEDVDAAICVSEHTRARTLTLTSVPTVVAPPAGRVEDAAISSSDVHKRASDEPLQVVFVGSLTPRKGVLTLLEGLTRVEVDREGKSTQSKGQPWELTLIGSLDTDPNYTRAVFDAIDQLGLEEWVTVTGAVNSDVIRSTLERSHVLAVPSRYEGFGMVYLEAMEYGVVPVAGTSGGTDEIVEDGWNGLTVPSDDPESIEAAIESLSDRQRLATLGTNALETARIHPTWVETMERVRSFLLAQRRSSTGETDRATYPGESQ